MCILWKVWENGWIYLKWNTLGWVSCMPGHSGKEREKTMGWWDGEENAQQSLSGTL